MVELKHGNIERIEEGRKLGEKTRRDRLVMLALFCCPPQ